MQLRISNPSTSLVHSPPSSRMPHRLTILFLAILFAGAAYYLYARSLNQRTQPQPEDTATKSGKRKTDSTTATVQDCNQQAQKLYDEGVANKDNIILALKNFTSALNCKPTDRELLGKIHYSLGYCYSGKQEYDQAIESYSKAISSGQDTPIYVHATLRHGKLYDFQKQDLKKALEDYETAIRGASQASNKPDSQLEMIARLLKSNALCRQSSEILHHKAVTQALQEIEFAFEIARTRETLKPLLVEIHYQRAICVHMLGNFQEADSDYTEALEQNAVIPYTQASLLCDRALCREKLGQHTLALQDYEAASEVEFTDPDPHKNLFGVSRIPLQTLPVGTPASYKNSAELKAAIESGKARMSTYRTPVPSPSSKPQDTYFQTPQ
jgi:tetratricopeptide (TPR) repeat protein